MTRTLPCLAPKVCSGRDLKIIGSLIQLFSLPSKSPGQGFASVCLSMPSNSASLIRALAKRTSCMPRRDQAYLVLGLVGEGAVGAAVGAAEVSSRLGGSCGALAACSITSLGGSIVAGGSPRCSSACQQEIQPQRQTCLRLKKLD